MEWHILSVWFTGQKAVHEHFLLGRDNLQGPAMKKLVLRFVNDRAAATAIEYAIIAAGISIVIVAAVNSIGTSLNSTFSSISSQLGGSN
jgi:pilus assembly protein Flp/PilA